MNNLCRAAFFALSVSGALSVATPVLALSGGASCEDLGPFRHGYAPGRFSSLPPRHERPILTRVAWSPSPQRDWAGLHRERPEWTYRSPRRSERADKNPAGPSASSDSSPSSVPATTGHSPARPDWFARRRGPRSLTAHRLSRPEWVRRPHAFDYPMRERTRTLMWLPPRPPFFPFSPPWVTSPYPSPEPAVADGARATGEDSTASTAAPPATGVEGTPANTAASPATTDTATAPEPVAGLPGVTDADNDGVADTTDFCAGTAPGTPVGAFGCTEAETIVLRGVNFQTDSAKLSDDSSMVLENVATTLIAHPEMHVEIAGHTDSDGDADDNFDLSSRRAIMVMKYLADAGVSPDNMIARGYGADRPIAPNDTPEGKAANRRVELNPLD